MTATTDLATEFFARRRGRRAHRGPRPDHRRDARHRPQCHRDTAELLAASETVVRPKEMHRSISRGTVFKQTAYLEAGVVDSTDETAAEAK